MSDTLTLTDFLLARIAEDESEIESFGEPPPMEEGPIPYPRLLAECKAKRRIVEACGEWWDPNDRRWLSCDGYHGGIQAAMEWLALPYADHPDFREEWRA